MRIALGGIDIGSLKARLAGLGASLRAFALRHTSHMPQPRHMAERLFKRARSFREGLADGSIGILTILRAAGGLFRRAGGETKAGLIFLGLLMVLTILPKPDPYAMPDAELRDDVGGALEVTARHSAAPYEASPWKSVRPSMAAYSLDAPELGRDAPIYRIRVTDDGARQDLLVFAPKDSRTLSGAVAVEQMPGAKRLTHTIYVETARRAALLGASIDRMAQPTGLETKFGAFEVADTHIIQQRQLRSCLAFRLVAEAPVEIAGLLCGEPQRPADRATLACVLDRLDLVSAGNDIELRRYFAAAERARLNCGKPAPARGPALKQVIFDGARIRG